jgi:hypothetical protein
MFAALATTSGKRLLISATIVLLGATAGTTLSQVATTHQHPSSAIIDGSAHPELIPDGTAYRLYFLMLANAPDATDTERARHATKLKRLGLGTADQQAASAILTGFKQQYRLLVETFDEQSRQSEGKGEQPDIKAFNTKRDQLVQATAASLRAALTADGWTALTTSVQAAKQNMQISAAGGGQ